MTETKFWERCRTTSAAECWPFQGDRDSGGYGRVKINKRKAAAHRIAWGFANGEIPEGMFVCHHCDNPPCCNPAHLFIGTALDNHNDAIGKGRRPPRSSNRSRKSTGRGKAFGERSGHAKLTEQDVREIRVAVGTGSTYSVLAGRFSVDKTTIRSVITGRTWKHVL